MDGKRIPFRPEDEERIASAALWGTIAAAAAAISAALTMVLVALSPMPAIGWIRYVLALALSILLGVWLVQACSAFRKVALTDVADKAYFLRGCDKLYRYFWTTGIVMILLILAAVTLFILSMVLGREVVLPILG